MAEMLVCKEFEQYTTVGEVEDEASGDEGSMVTVKDVLNMSFPTNIIIKHADYDAMLLQAGGNIFNKLMAFVLPQVQQSMVRTRPLLEQ